MKYISIDEEGYFLSQGIRWTDPEAGLPLLQNLRRTQNNAWVTSYKPNETSEFYYVEAFDQPLVALRVEAAKDFIWKLQTPYEFQAEFDVRKLSIDEWDRFLGRTINNISFVFSRAAQDQFFKQLESFDDDSFVVNGQKITPLLWPSLNTKNIGKEDWDQAYIKSEAAWDLGEAHPSLPSVSAQIKLSRCRVLVLGCGTGHDAAYFAKQGHFVTAVDWSDEAIARAMDLYGTIANLSFIKADALKLPAKMMGKYDLVFEHTCYCAIPPEKRNDLVKSWKQVLTDQGQLLAILPVFDKDGGPPFSSSEWELRQRLQKDFRFLYWSRSRVTTPRRLGQELIVFAQR